VPAAAWLADVPSGYALSRGRILTIYGALSMSLLLSALDQTIVATVMPRVVSQLGGFGLYQWAFTAYTLAATITVPVYGKLGDIFGRRRMFAIAISVFVVSSAGSGLAESMPELIACRALQGLGAGALFPLALATVGDIVPIRERGRYQALLNSGAVVGAIAGPIAGGVIADTIGWRAVFLINVPIGVVVLLIVLATLPRTQGGRARSIDWAGAVALALATTSLLLGLTWGGQQYAWSASPVIGVLLVCAASVAVLVAVERRAADPILPHRFVGSRHVIACVLASGLTSMAMFGVMSYVPLLVQAVLGGSSASSGVSLMPLLIGDIAASVLTGQVIARTGRLRPTARVGPIVMTAGIVLVWQTGVESSTAYVAWAMLITGVGIGLMNQVFTVSVQNAVPTAVMGSAVGLVQLARSIGASLGVALVGTIVDGQVSGRLRSSLDDGTGLSGLPYADRVTLLHALRPGFLVLAVVGVIVFVIVLAGVEDVTLRRTVD
jgi:EmrB/QacA subfamily drug resistance transporter